MYLLLFLWYSLPHEAAPALAILLRSHALNLRVPLYIPSWSTNASVADVTGPCFALPRLPSSFRNQFAHGGSCVRGVPRRRLKGCFRDKCRWPRRRTKP
ncbi:hypothetical protein B0H11DRAFT_2088756 [Mycena galericulata]|nr:hypothetical protein B0H11DRAFT_2088756 [Mycena galericulata]